MYASETVTVTGGTLLQLYPTSTSSTEYKGVMAIATSTFIKLVGSSGDDPECVLLRKN